MAWNPFTPATFAQRLAGPELNALKNAARGSGQTADTLITECITRVVAEIRGYVSGCSRNTLGPADTIPDELQDAACAITVYRFITRLPGSKSLLDAARTANYTDALELLKSVAACRFGIVPPEVPADDNQQASGSGAELVSSRENIQTRQQLSGLM